jgi:hypothetical protein
MVRAAEAVGTASEVGLPRLVVAVPVESLGVDAGSLGNLAVAA